MVSWTRSSASAGLPVSRSATRYRLSRWISASRSKLARFSASAAGVEAGGGGDGERGGTGGVMVCRNLSPCARVPQWGGGVLRFARRGPQHRPARRPGGGQEPRHAGRGRTVGVCRGALVQAARPLGHRGHAAARVRGDGAARRPRRSGARRGAAATGGAAPRRRPGVRRRRPPRRPAGRAAPLRTHAPGRARCAARIRVRGGAAGGACRVWGRVAAGAAGPDRAGTRRARGARHSGRLGLRPVRHRLHGAAPAARRVRGRHAPHLVPGDGRGGVRVARRPTRSAPSLMSPPLLDGFDFAALADALAALGADGWLVYDFRKVNPIAERILGATGMGTRRLFVLLPRAGRPVAIAHRIELQPLADFPGDVRPYGSWRELHGHLGALVRGRTLAVEISPLDQVPYLDRVPHGVVQLLESFGAHLVSSAPLVSRFAARWSAAELAGHRAAAEALAGIARDALSWTGSEAARGAEVDDAARGVIRDAGLGDYFVHRTGHSIDRDLHGSGPHIDNFETEDARPLVPGVGFSVEPGVYLPERFGIRSEINVYIDTTGPEVNPRTPQHELFLL